MFLTPCRRTDEYGPVMDTYSEMGDSNVHTRLMVLVSRLKESLVKDEDIRYAVEMADMNL